MTSRTLRIFNYFFTNSFLPTTALIFFFSVGCQPQILESEAPFFAITTYETEFYEKGNVFELDGNSQKPTVINFWFPSCPPCVKEMPDIDSVYRLYKDQIDVVGVQMIGLDSVSDGSDFVREAAIGYAVGPDKDGSIAVNYGVTGFPTTIFVDSERQIFKSWQGEIKSEQMKEILDTLVRVE